MLALILALAAIVLYCRTWWFSLPLLAAVISLNGVSVPVGISLELPQLLICILLALWVLSGKIRLSGLYEHAWFLGVAAAWIAYVGVSGFLNHEVPLYEPEAISGRLTFANVGTFYILWLTLNLLTILLILHAVRTEERLTSIIDALLKGSIVVSVYAIFQYLSMTLGFYSPWIVFVPNEEYLAVFNVEGNRALGLSREPLYFASYLIFVISLFGSLLISKSGKTALSRLTLATGLALAIVALALTKSTGGFVAVLASLLSIVLVYGVMRTRVLLWGALGAAALLVTLGLNASLYLHRLQAMMVFVAHGQDAALYSSYQRVHSFVEAIQVIGERFWTGTGIGRAPYFLSMQQVHNGYLNAMLETGVIGLALLLFLFLYPLTRTGGALRRLGRKSVARQYPWLIGLAAGLVGIMTQLLSYYAYMQTLIWFFMGLLLAGLTVLKDPLHESPIAGARRRLARAAGRPGPALTATRIGPTRD